jgi:hypothetical protein
MKKITNILVRYLAGSVLVYALNFVFQWVYWWVWTFLPGAALRSHIRLMTPADGGLLAVNGGIVYALLFAGTALFPYGAGLVRRFLPSVSQVRSYMLSGFATSFVLFQLMFPSDGGEVSWLYIGMFAFRVHFILLGGSLGYIFAEFSTHGKERKAIAWQALLLSVGVTLAQFCIEVLHAEHNPDQSFGFYYLLRTLFCSFVFLYSAAQIARSAELEPFSGEREINSV